MHLKDYYFANRSLQLAKTAHLVLDTNHSKLSSPKYLKLVHEDCFIWLLKDLISKQKALKVLINY